MKIFIAYKHSGVPEKQLKPILERLSDELIKQGHETFIFMRDIQKWQLPTQTLGEIMTLAFREIEKSDVLLCWINTDEPSGGVNLEVGYALAKNKKLVVLICDDSESIESYRYMVDLADKVVRFYDIEDLFKKFPRIE